MDNIEWYWNIARQTLDLALAGILHDIIIPILPIRITADGIQLTVGSSIHRLFDIFSWVFVPEESIVDQHYQSLSLLVAENLLPLVQDSRRSRYVSTQGMFPHQTFQAFLSIVTNRARMTLGMPSYLSMMI